MLTRRESLGLMGAGLAVGMTRFPGYALAAADTDNRLVVVLLRGGMDGLSAVQAYGDPDFESLRKSLALPKPGDVGGSLKLDAMFALHPNLSNLASLYAQGELVVVHAQATPYRDRSHFDGQNLLENGSERPYGLDTGWLNRVVAQLPGNNKPLGVALNAQMPLMMQGPALVSSWSPSILASPDADTVQRLAALYGETDPVLARSFAAAQNANSVADGSKGGGQNFTTLMSAAAKFLAAPDGARVAMVEITGWDTHVNQAGAFSPLSRNMTTLDQGIEALKIGLGPTWHRTAVIIVSEFGRTVAMNGTGGTDHGTAGVAFLAGGAIAGGRVIADWPGLKPQNLYAGRDLMPTTDFRVLAMGLLKDHLALNAKQLETVFPSSTQLRPHDGLIRV